MQAYGCEIISDPGVIPVKFRAPGGTVCELVPKAGYKKPRKKEEAAEDRAWRTAPATSGPGSRSPRSAATSSTAARGWEYLGQDGPGPGFFPLWYGIAMLVAVRALVLILKGASRRRGIVDWRGSAARFARLGRVRRFGRRVQAASAS